jgi:2-keto-4-pentenoate hydratase/2-oxohepta-3-ene-1,7-dioic acid hydratase in catechol pathway
MRLLRYEHEGQVGIGARVDKGVVATGYNDLIDLIEDGQSGIAAAARAVADTEPFTPDRVLAPLVPRKLMFHSINFASIVDETPGTSIPSISSFFSKLPSAVIGPDDPIRKPAPDTHLDWEVELAIVVGRRSSALTEADALRAVFGYTVANDISARDIQIERGDIMLGKGLDTFCPLGPEVVLTDEIPDPHELVLATYVNGERVQQESTANQIFSVERILATVSAHVTLEPGDIVTTGTPAGLGLNMSPPRWLQPGDEVTVEVDRIGSLTNRVEAGWRPDAHDGRDTGA